MAPPKKKTTGRVTPKGTRPGEAPRGAASSAGSSGGSGGTSGGGGSSGSGSSGGAGAVGASSRYTPPIPKELRESPRWVPILMFVLLGIGGLVILLRYLVWPDSNLPVLFGLGFMLAGLYTATKWH